VARVVTLMAAVGWRVVPLALAVALAAGACTAAPATRASPAGTFPAATAGRISAYLDGLAAGGMLTGTVLVTRNGMSYTAAFGYADRAARTPDTDQTEYRLGSVSKQFTAMGVLLLAARHRLSVTGRLCRYLPGCPAGWHAITIADLLDHTSGIPDYLNDLDARWPPEPATPGQLIASFAAAPLHFAPGTRMRYSNSGYVLLGVLIERITGQRLAAFLQQNIFGPLAMTRTGTDTTEIRTGHARGYYADGSQPAAYPLSAFFADGGLYSTVADLQRWDDAVQDSTLIPAALTAQMLAVHAVAVLQE
jgi:CubicO group peptidase (beta-lactamase class C family)